jgi:hypothetical protein
MKTNKLYLYSTILLMLLLPALSVVIDFVFTQHHSDLISLAGKWFIFWAIGCRLLIAGLRQAIKPAFTAETIFNIKDKESYVIIRELGLANICTGLTAIISLSIPQWRIVIAFSGGLFFGLAGLLHIIRKPDNSNELIPLISNIFIFLIMVVYSINYLMIGK